MSASAKPPKKRSGMRLGVKAVSGCNVFIPVIGYIYYIGAPQSFLSPD
jgi:hypothetical protein